MAQESWLIEKAGSKQHANYTLEWSLLDQRATPPCNKSLRTPDPLSCMCGGGLGTRLRWPNNRLASCAPNGGTKCGCDVTCKLLPTFISPLSFFYSFWHAIFISLFPFLIFLVKRTVYPWVLLVVVLDYSRVTRLSLPTRVWLRETAVQP